MDEEEVISPYFTGYVRRRPGDSDRRRLALPNVAKPGLAAAMGAVEAAPQIDLAGMEKEAAALRDMALGQGGVLGPDVLHLGEGLLPDGDSPAVQAERRRQLRASPSFKRYTAAVRARNEAMAQGVSPKDLPKLPPVTTATTAGNSTTPRQLRARMLAGDELSGREQAALGTFLRAESKRKEVGKERQAAVTEQAKARAQARKLRMDGPGPTLLAMLGGQEGNNPLALAALGRPDIAAMVIESGKVADQGRREDAKIKLEREKMGRESSMTERLLALQEQAAKDPNKIFAGLPDGMQNIQGMRAAGMPPEFIAAAEEQTVAGLMGNKTKVSDLPLLKLKALSLGIPPARVEEILAKLPQQEERKWLPEFDVGDIFAKDKDIPGWLNPWGIFGATPGRNIRPDPNNPGMMIADR